MEDNSLNVLIITNMCASKKSPYQGKFVRDQVSAIKNLDDNSGIDFFEMPVIARKTDSFAIRYLIFMFAFFFKYVLSSKKYDIIHIHFFFPTIILGYVYKLLRNKQVKLVATFHGSDIYSYTPPGRLYRFMANQLCHAIFVSHLLEQRFFKHLNSSTVISAGINNSFNPLLSEKLYDFIFVGTLDDNKGVLRLLDSLTQIKEQLTIAIVGEGPHKSEVILRAAKSHHEIQLFGFVEHSELNLLYNQSRFLVNLSQNESFGLVLAEAMACGVPVIATLTDGSKTQIIDNENGLFILDTEPVSEVLIRANNIKDYKKFSENAIVHGKRQKLDYVAKEVSALYRELLAK